MKKKVIEIIKKYSIIEKFELSDELVTLGIDSLLLVEVILAIEDELKIEFSPDKLSPKLLIEVEDVVKLVEACTS